MIRIISRLTLLCVTISCFGCTAPTDPKQPRILASFDAISLIVEQVVGDIPVSSLLEGGVSPHAYAPRPSEMVALREATLVVYAHPFVDGWMGGLRAQSSVSLFGEHSLSHEGPSASGFEDPHSHETGMDPHQWNDPEAVLDVLPGLADALCEALPADCPAVRRRTAVFASELSAFQDSLHSAKPDGDGSVRCFVTAQPFMDQFLTRFEFPFVGPLSVSADVEPSPTSLARMVGEAHARGCRHLIVQSAFENTLERRLAREQSWEIIEVDPLGYGAAMYQHYLRGLHTALMTPGEESVRPEAQGEPSTTDSPDASTSAP